MIVQCALLKSYTILGYSTRDSSVNIPLPPDQHDCSDETKWRLGGEKHVHYMTQFFTIILTKCRTCSSVFLDRQVHMFDVVW